MTTCQIGSASLRKVDDMHLAERKSMGLHNEAPSPQSQC